MISCLGAFAIGVCLWLTYRILSSKTIATPSSAGWFSTKEKTKYRNVLSYCKEESSPELCFCVVLFLKNNNKSVREKAHAYLMENMRYNIDSHTTKRLYCVVKEATEEEVKLRGAILLCEIFRFHRELVSSDMIDLVREVTTQGFRHKLMREALSAYSELCSRVTIPSTKACLINLHHKTDINNMHSSNDEEDYGDCIFDEATTSMQQDKIDALYAFLVQRNRLEHGEEGEARRRGYDRRYSMHDASKSMHALELTSSIAEDLDRMERGVREVFLNEYLDEKVDNDDDMLTSMQSNFELKNFTYMREK